MALKTKKPDFTSSDAGEQIAALIDYINELTEEIEFKFEVLTGAVEKLRQMNSRTTEGSDSV